MKNQLRKTILILDQSKITIAKTRIGDVDEGIKILNDLYNNRKDADVALAISDYHILSITIKNQ